MHQKMMIMVMKMWPDDEEEIIDIDPAGEYEKGDDN